MPWGKPPQSLEGIAGSGLTGEAAAADDLLGRDGQGGPAAQVRGQEVQEKGQAQEEDRAVQEEALVGQEASDGQAASEAQEVQEDRENQEDHDIQEFLEALVGQVVLEDREAELRHHPRRTARGPQQRAAGHQEMQDWRTC